MDGGNGTSEARPEEEVPTGRGCTANGSGGNGGQARRKRNAQVHIKVATLNMKGWGAANSSRPSEKWMRINQIIKEKKIAILALQETHLNQARKDTIDQIFGQYMEVVYSAEAKRETRARGVAFVINKRIFKKLEYETRTLVEGSAMLLDIVWSGTNRLKLANVYAPNDPAGNAALWDALRGQRVGRIDLLLGDFNMVEDALDRYPAREDKPETMDALKELTAKWRVRDGWRDAHAGEIAFTYQHTNGTSQSRLDRIYASRFVRRSASNWSHKESGTQTDHKLAYVEIADRQEPHVGKGRWAMPVHLLRDEEMRKTMLDLATEFLSELEEQVGRTDERNPQTAYRTFKDGLTRHARERAKKKIPKMQKRLEALRKDRDALLDGLARQCSTNRDTPRDERREETTARNAAVLQDRITKLEEKRFEATRRRTAARCKLNNETMTREWIRANYTPPDLEISGIRELRFEGTPGLNAQYTNNSKKMAEIAKTHYDQLQNDGVAHDDAADREGAISEALAPMEA
ncbi:Endonuclease/exonuclease/phosphatase [Cubamyces menziesii]|nr:Endonuclease/exonuclease/phosphatase [Cubamyces menziesii]